MFIFRKKKNIEDTLVQCTYRLYINIYLCGLQSMVKTDTGETDNYSSDRFYYDFLKKEEAWAFQQELYKNNLESSEDFGASMFGCTFHMRLPRDNMLLFFDMDIKSIDINNLKEEED
jgi:hypothetical protein